MPVIKKRRHHYVWRKYLRAWAVDEKIFCLLENKIIKPNLMGVAQERDFYKLKSLNNADIDFIKEVIARSPIESIKDHENTLNSLTSLQEFFDNPPKSLEGTNEADALLYNIEEDMHWKVESLGEKHLNSLLNGDISFFYTDTGFMEFIFYLSTQYMRTKKIREGIKSDLNQQVHLHNIENTWNILSHVFSKNMALSLYSQKENFKLVFIKNESDLEFITGDQPVINPFACSTPKGEAPERIAFYYPISPLSAILIIENKYFLGKTEMTYGNKEVISHNKAIKEQSFKQIYASKKCSLESELET